MSQHMDPYLVAIKVGAAAIGDEADHERVARRVLEAAEPVLREAWRLEQETAVAGHVEQVRRQLDDLTTSWWEVLGQLRQGM